jgi:putative transposase
LTFEAVTSWHSFRCCGRNRKRTLYLSGIVNLTRNLPDSDMKALRSRYHGHRYPPEIITHAVWLYYSSGLSLKDVEDLPAKRGIVVSYETIRRWGRKFGLDYARRLRQRQGRLGATWFRDEVWVTINGQRQYLWRPWIKTAT